MGPKKEEVPEAFNPRTMGFPIAEKSMYEFQLEDANKKLERMKKSIQNYEVRNEKLQKDINVLDVEKAEVIASLRRTLSSRSEENTELQERVSGLEELIALEAAEFNQRIKDLQTMFVTTKNQLTADNKLLNSKVNSLEEFRAVRNELQEKYEIQEQNLKDKEMDFKRRILDVEKKLVMDKDKLKKEMEAVLLQLAQDFQDDSESRVAASTHRVIRENIALENILDTIILTGSIVSEQNEMFNKGELDARNAIPIIEDERDKAICKSIVQSKVIHQLTKAFESAQKENEITNKAIQNYESLEAKMVFFTKENETIRSQISILEQKLHACISQRKRRLIEKTNIVRERDHYKKTLRDAVVNIQAAIKVIKLAEIDSNYDLIEDRECVLRNILNVIDKRLGAVQTESTDSVLSLSAIYEKGDLGFLPSIMEKTKIPSVGSISKLPPKESSKDKRSLSMEISLVSMASLKTIPEIPIIPPFIGHISEVKFVPSFTVTSTHSSEESEESTEGSQEELMDISKQLEKSKIELQKCISKDLAMMSSPGISRSHVEFRSSKASSTIAERDESSEASGETVIDEHNQLIESEGDTIAGDKEEDDRNQVEQIDEDNNETDITEREANIETEQKTEEGEDGAVK